MGTVSDLREALGRIGRCPFRPTRLNGGSERPEELRVQSGSRATIDAFKKAREATEAFKKAREEAAGETDNRPGFFRRISWMTAFAVASLTLNAWTVGMLYHERAAGAWRTELTFRERAQNHWQIMLRLDERLSEAEGQVNQLRGLIHADD